MSLAPSALDVSRQSPSLDGAAPMCVHCGLPIPASRRSTGGEPPPYCCFGCRFAYELARPAIDAADDAKTTPGNTLLLRLGLGIFLTMNIKAFSGLFYSSLVYGSATGDPLTHHPLQQLIAYLLMLLTTCVMATLGMPLLEDVLAGWRLPRGDGVARWRRWLATMPRRVDANLLICIGVAAAFILSAFHTLQGYGTLYFDTAALILTLVTLGHYLDSTARHKATAAARDLLATIPTRAWVARGNDIVEIDADTVEVGQRLRVRPGETVPVDGRVAEGTGYVNEASLTGESTPRAVSMNDTVMAGSVSVDGQLWIEATQVGDDRTLAQTQRLLDAARLHQLPIQRVVDRIAAVFVPGVVLLALAVFVYHAVVGDATTGLFDALSVLLISCPCALGLAAPLATWSALHRAARAGILIDSAVTLERAATVTHVFFDKTGTLTEPTLRVQRIDTAEDVNADDALRWAAAVESSSAHPMAKAIIDAAAARSLNTLASARAARALPGLGVEAVVAGERYWLGNERLVRERGVQPLPTSDGSDATTAANEPGMHVFLMNDSRVLARFTLSEVLRRDARNTVAQLRQLGIDATILTGDRAPSAKRVADALRIGVASSLLPADKLDHLLKAQQRIGASTRRHGRIAMVGDGINDGPVLAAADVGFALRCSTSLAQQAGNVRLLTDRLDRVPLTIRLARHAMRRVRLNLVWAFGYNTIGLALAAAGYLNPIFAASAMFISSMLIVTTSRRAGDVVEESPTGIAEVAG